MQSELLRPLILGKTWTQLLRALFILISPKALLLNTGGRASTYGLAGGKDSAPVSVVYGFHMVTERFGDPGLNGELDLKNPFVNPSGAPHTLLTECAVELQIHTPTTAS